MQVANNGKRFGRNSCWSGSVINGLIYFARATERRENIFYFLRSFRRPFLLCLHFSSRDSQDRQWRFIGALAPLSLLWIKGKFLPTLIKGKSGNLLSESNRICDRLSPHCLVTLEEVSKRIKIAGDLILGVKIFVNIASAKALRASCSHVNWKLCCEVFQLTVR